MTIETCTTASPWLVVLTDPEIACPKLIKKYSSEAMAWKVFDYYADLIVEDKHYAEYRIVLYCNGTQVDAYPFAKQEEKQP